MPDEGAGVGLQQLRLQTEALGVRVDRNLERMRNILFEADPRMVSAMVSSEAGINDMAVALTKLGYALLRGRTVGYQVRLIVASIQIASAFERSPNRLKTICPTGNLRQPVQEGVS